MSATKTPHQLVTLLNELFSRFDRVCQKHNVEKIKTIGDAYMAVGGVPSRMSGHALAIADMALEVMESVKEFNETLAKEYELQEDLQIRIGIHTGPCVAGVVGKMKYAYELYGETVNYAAAMESFGVSGKIQISEETATILRDHFVIEERGEVDLKTFGTQKTYFLISRLSSLDSTNSPARVPPSPHRALRDTNSFSIQQQNPMWKWINDDIERLSEAKLHKLTLAFNSKPLEQSFHEWWILRHLRSFRIGVIILLALFLLSDFMFTAGLPSDPHIRSWDRILRYGIVCFCWIVLLLLSFSPSSRWVKRLNQPFISAVALLSGACILLLGFYDSIYWFGLAGVYLADFFLVKLRFQYAILNVGLLHVAFLVVAFIHGWKTLELTIFLFSVFLTSALSSHFLETHTRKAFLDQQILVKEQERLHIEQSKSEELLVNLLPLSIAEKLKSGEKTIASRFEEVSILFVHVAGTTKLMNEFGIVELFKYVNTIFCKFDELTQKHRLEKIKTIGTTYMVAGNLPTEVAKHAESMLDLCYDIIRFISTFSAESGHQFSLRMGINVGPCVAGVIGTKKWTYDLWGDVVNVASRMESSGVGGKIHVSEAVYKLLKDSYNFEERGEVHIKGKGMMTTYFAAGRKLAPKRPESASVATRKRSVLPTLERRISIVVENRHELAEPL